MAGCNEKDMVQQAFGIRFLWMVGALWSGKLLDGSNDDRVSMFAFVLGTG